jgi:hypothetical protein
MHFELLIMNSFLLPPKTKTPPETIRKGSLYDDVQSVDQIDLNFIVIQYEPSSFCEFVLSSNPWSLS